MELSEEQEMCPICQVGPEEDAQSSLVSALWYWHAICDILVELESLLCWQCCHAHGQ